LVRSHRPGGGRRGGQPITRIRLLGQFEVRVGGEGGISKSEVSRICADLDTEVGAFRDRSLVDQAFPYVFLDATYCKARVNHRVGVAGGGDRHRRPC
jgi:Transposase, Mutator family